MSKERGRPFQGYEAPYAPLAVLDDPYAPGVKRARVTIADKSGVMSVRCGEKGHIVAYLLPGQWTRSEYTAYVAGARNPYDALAAECPSCIRHWPGKENK